MRILSLIMIDNETITKLKQKFDENCILKITTPRPRRIFVFTRRNCFREVIHFLNNMGFTHLSGITGYQNCEDSIEVLYHLEKKGILVTVRVSLPLNEGALSTITDIIPGSVLYEREIHDLLGIKFEGHPDLQRLILPDEWPNESHPLRKTQATEPPNKK